MHNPLEMKLTAIISAFIRIAAIMLFLVGPVTVSAQYKMVVHTDDGLSYSFNTEKIEKVSFVLMTDDEDDEDITSVTGNASEITNNSATIIALAQIPGKTSMDSNVGIIFTTTGTPSNENGKQVTVSPSSLGSDGKYTVKLTDLAPSTIYYYRSFVCQNGTWFYGEVKEFTTLGKAEDPIPGGGEGIGGGEYD